MHHIKAQTQFAEATAGMMRAYALVAARAASLSASRGMSLWAQMLAASAKSPWATHSRLGWDPLRSWATWSRPCTPPSTLQPPAEPAQAPVEQPAPDLAFSSYRSSGGHAVAQVIVG